MQFFSATTFFLANMLFFCPRKQKKVAHNSTFSVLKTGQKPTQTSIAHRLTFVYCIMTLIFSGGEADYDTGAIHINQRNYVKRFRGDYTTLQMKQNVRLRLFE